MLERDINDAADDVREKVSGAMRALPPQVLPPVIQKVDPDSDPIMAIVLSSDTMSLRSEVRWTGIPPIAGSGC